MTRTTSGRRLQAGLFRRTAATSTAALLLAGGVLTGCGSDDAEPTGTDSTPTASPTESESPVEPDTTVEAGGDTEEFLEVYRAAFDDATTAHMTMELAGGASALTAEGDADYTTNPLTMRMSISSPALGAEGIEMRLVDGVMYLQVPGLNGKFVTMDLDDPNNPLGSSLTDQMDPRTQFETFEQGIVGATYVGEEDVEGEQLDHWTVQLDTEALLDSMDPAARAQAETGMPPQLTYEVYFDSDGRYRRMEVDMGTGGTVLVSFDDWGKAVDVKAPPPNQVTVIPGAGG